MNYRLQTVALLLFTALLLPSCLGDDGAAQPADTLTDGAVQEELPQSALWGKLNIGGTAIDSFNIVRSDYAKDTAVKAAVRLKACMEESFGISLASNITTDWRDNEVLPHEIVVGKTERLSEADYPETAEALGARGFFIMERGGKIYIIGGSEEGSALGVERFIADFIEGRDTIVMPIDYTYISYHEYDIQKLTIAGRDIGEFSIVTGRDGSSENAAKIFAALIAEAAGVTLEITTDASVSPAIRMNGAALPVDGVVQVTCKDGELVFASTAQDGMEACVNAFCERYLIGAVGAFDIPEGFIYNDFTDSITMTLPN